MCRSKNTPLKRRLYLQSAIPVCPVAAPIAQAIIGSKPSNLNNLELVQEQFNNFILVIIRQTCH